MTYREKYHSTTEWNKKIFILYTYHNLMLLRRKDWRISDTARVIKISIGKVSEDIKLAENFEKVNDCTSRNAALKRIKK